MSESRRYKLVFLYFVGSISVAGIVCETSLTLTIAVLALGALTGILSVIRRLSFSLHIAAMFFFLLLHAQYFTLSRLSVSGPSMEPALVDGQKVYVSRHEYGILCPPILRALVFKIDFRRCGSSKNANAGDMVVIRYPGLNPDGDGILVKRIVAGPGDTYEFTNGKLKINDQERAESYVHTRTMIQPMTVQPPVHRLPEEIQRLGDFAVYAASFGLPGKGQVPENSYLVLGDNRDHSRDSRSIGFIPMQFILGKVIQ